MRAFVALLSGIDGGVTTGGEAVCVLGAGVGAEGGDDDATVDGAFGVGREATSKVGVAFVGTGAGGRDAGGIVAGKVGGTRVASEEGIAGVGTLTWESDTDGVLAFGVLSTVHDAIALVGAGTLESDAGLSFANSVGFGATTDDGIALIGTLSNDRDTGIALASSMFVTLDAGGAFIGTRAVLSETGVGSGADKVHLACTIGVRSAGIGAGALESDAGVVLTCGVGDRATALGGFTKTSTGAREKNTDITLALRVLVAAHFRSTGRSAGARDGDALILGITFVMELSATAEDRVTGVTPGTRDDKTG